MIMTVFEHRLSNWEINANFKSHDQWFNFRSQHRYSKILQLK